MHQKALFISDKNHVSAEIMGGVQLCTQEYLRYLSLAGYDCQIFEVSPHISGATKLKIKLGIDVYDKYPVKGYLQNLAAIINDQDIKFVFLNQLSLCIWADKLRKHTRPTVRYIGLSHGNESGDYIHEILQGDRRGPAATYKMGKLLENEAKIFSSMLDGVVVMSEQEAAISQWLGAKNVLYLPRLLSPNYIDRKATVPIAGFAGTLDHLPNRLGLELLAGELAKLNFNHKMRVIGGPESIGRQLQSNYPFIEYAGPVADSALAYEIAKWSVWINPIFWYARGASTKLAQAINWGIPCITTPAGRRGYELSNTEIVTADNTAAGFAQKLMLALNDSSCLDELHHAVQENAENFNTGHFVEQLVMFLDKIATSA